MDTRTAHCFAHNHLTPAEYGLYVLLRELSSKNNFKYHFDDRALTRRFAAGRGVSRQTVNRLRLSLADKGFIAWETDLRGNGGKYESRVGRILSHKEWAATNRGKCSAMLTGEHEPCSPVSSTVLISDDSPCSPVGHRRDRSNATEIEADRCSAAPLPSSGSAILLNSDSNTPCSPVSTVDSGPCSPVSTDDPVTELARLMEAHVSVRQRIDGLPNLDLVTKLSANQARLAFEGAITDSFWDSKLSGSSALRTFCKHLSTILKQQRSNAARQHQGKPSVPKHKAASVTPTSNGFAYVGEIL